MDILTLLTKGSKATFLYIFASTSQTLFYQLEMTKIIIILLVVITVVSCEKQVNDSQYLFPENFRVIMRLHYPDEKAVNPGESATFEYDENWSVIKETRYSESGDIYFYHQYTYADNLLSERRTYQRENGELQQVNLIKYEYSGDNMTKETHFRKDGTTVYSINNEYSGENMISSSKLNGYGETEYKHDYTYNDFNLVVLDESYYSQQLSGSTRYTYDDEIDQDTGS